MSHHHDGCTYLTDAESLGVEPVQGPRIRINVENAGGEQIKAFLGACGGRPSPVREGRSYEFATEAARDYALNEARCWFGWTCVDPD